MMTNVRARTATRSPLPTLTERMRLGLLDVESNQNKEVEIEMLNRKRVSLLETCTARLSLSINPTK